ncbi:MAG: leucine--tRNA ligase [Candidatus Saccharimonadales bacterium]
MQRYNPKDIEQKWQKVWADTKIYEAVDDSAKPKKYILEYFPYPSGAAMHVGHVRNYTIGDVVARFYRMQGHNVLHPMGWDAFGLPAENYAIKNNISPEQAIAENTSKFKQQLMQMGFSYDWSREINSSNPNYYKWTQYFFTVLFDRGLTYQKDSLQWWCEHDKTVLANEQVEAGKCWRCGNPVVKKALKQWFFKITDYADRLSDDLDKLDWSDAIKTMQKNWIGKSKGMVFTSPVKDTDLQIETFSAHFEAFKADTFVVIAPDHPFLKKLVKGTPEEQKVLDYAAQMVIKRDAQGFADEENVDGIFTGRYVVDPVGNGDLPIWIASYALSHYGTGIVKCSAHDERDFRFAKKYGIKLKTVLFPADPAEAEKVRNQKVCYSDMQHGILTEPEVFNGKVAGQLRENIIEFLENNQLATSHVTYKIRDWLISRQRYWGAPIPIIHCPEHGAVPVPKDQLPVELPEVESYQPNGEGTSVLASVADWVNTICPICDGPAKRETDTMDGFACSSWYFLRFADPHNNEEPFAKDKVKYWLPVDDYIGGAEHAVMHLLYARMWTKVFYDAGMIDFDEPFLALRNQGMILAPDGRKMSKSWGNTITPDDIIEQGYGADAIRVMELFIGPWNQSANWSVEGMGGCYRFLNRVWTITHEFLESNDSAGAEQPGLFKALHKATKKISNDMLDMGFNTSISSLMELTNELYKIKADSGFADKEGWRTALKTFMQLLAPFAPHITEELWQQLGGEGSVHVSEWPIYDEKYLAEDSITLAVQVNGKVRTEITVASDTSEDAIKHAALEQERIKELLAGKEPKKVIYVPGRLVSVVV